MLYNSYFNKKKLEFSEKDISNLNINLTIRSAQIINIKDILREKEIFQTSIKKGKKEKRTVSLIKISSSTK